MVRCRRSESSSIVSMTSRRVSAGSARRRSVCRYSLMLASGVFSSWVTAWMKASCCSLLRISRIRNAVFSTSPPTSTTKLITPSSTRSPARQLTTMKPTLRAAATAISPLPSSATSTTERLRFPPKRCMRRQG